MEQDNDLMARLALGDLAALETLIARYRPWAEKAARSLLHDGALAEDVVQEAFARIYLARNAYRPDFTFRTYFTVVLRRLCVDQLRRRAHQPVPMADLPEVNAASAEADYLRRDRMARLWRALDQLDETDQALLLGVALEDKSYRQLTDELGLTLPQVKIRLHRVRARLRQGEENDDA